MKPLCVSKELQLPVEEGLIMDCGFSMTLENDEWLGRCACELYNFFDFFPTEAKYFPIFLSCAGNVFSDRIEQINDMC